MEFATKTATRKKVVVWLAAAIGSVTLFRFLPNRKKGKPETITMLTEDGKLVEISKDLLAGPSRKISDKELQQWIKK